MSRVVSWCLLVVWCAWMFAFQGVLASSPSVARWTPDLGVVLLLAINQRMERGDALMTVAIVSGARIAFTSDAPLAILVGYASLVFVARRLRRVAEIDRVVTRTLLAALGAALLTGYWALTRSIALAADSVRGMDVRAALEGSRMLDAAIATGVVASLLGPLLVRLPGMSLLRVRPPGSPFGSRR